MPQKKKKPLEQAIVVRKYDKLAAYAKQWAKGNYNLIVLVGRGGLGKSRAVKDAVGKNALWIESNASAFGMYTALYKHQGKPVVIDDVDRLYNDKLSVNLLKCICQTDPVKHVSWHTAAAGDGKEVPKDFDTTSKVIIVCNDWQRLNANVEALESRAKVLVFEPDVGEIHRRASEWFWDQEIHDWVGKRIHLFPRLSQRTYYHLYEDKRAKMPFEEVLFSQGFDETAVAVAEIIADERLTSEPERVARFKEVTGSSRATYYRHKKKLEPPRGKKRIEVPKYKLKMKRPPRTPKRAAKVHARADVPNLKVVGG